MAKVVVFGATGFVGRAAAQAFAESGDEVTPSPARRLRAEPFRIVELADSLDARATAGAAARRTGSPTAPGPDTTFEEVLVTGLVGAELVDDVASSLTGLDVVVNAAGSADATSPVTPELFGANALWPLVLGLACERARVGRLVHVSTAAVQWGIRVLDDSPRYAPVSPYSETKVLGERLLTGLAGTGRLSVVLYRPPSVHGPERALTRAFVRWCDRFPLVVSGKGDQPVPVALIGNVAAALVALAVADDPPLIVSHPSEGYTVGSLYESVAPGKRIWSLPPGMVRAGLRALEPVGRAFPQAAAASWRLELLLLGQAQAPSWLESQRFVLPCGPAELAELARGSRAGGRVV